MEEAAFEAQGQKKMCQTWNTNCVR